MRSSFQPTLRVFVTLVLVFGMLRPQLIGTRSTTIQLVSQHFLKLELSSPTPILLCGTASELRLPGTTMARFSGSARTLWTPCCGISPMSKVSIVPSSLKGSMLTPIFTHRSTSSTGLVRIYQYYHPTTLSLLLRILPDAESLLGLGRP